MFFLVGKFCLTYDQMDIIIIKNVQNLQYWFNKMYSNVSLLHSLK